MNRSARTSSAIDPDRCPAAGPAQRTGDGPSRRDRMAGGSVAGPARTRASACTIGVEEEFHVVDLARRELVPRAAELLERLSPNGFTAELHRSVIESNTPVCAGLDGLRDHLVRLRRRIVAVAAPAGLGIVAAGTTPLVDPAWLGITPGRRYSQMLEDYQLLVREQIICGVQVHVAVPDRDEAVAVLPRLAPWLPVLLALSASSPYWMGVDTGYASMRSLIWQRWPTAGAGEVLHSAAEYDTLVADLISAGVISDPGMIYFDVRPSAHVPTLELRLTDACPDVDTVVLLAGLFRALVRREREAHAAGSRLATPPRAMLRAATWRAARSGLEDQLVDLTGEPRPVPAAAAVLALVRDLRQHLEAEGDWDQVRDLAQRAVARGSSAAAQRRSFARRGRLCDVVDHLVQQTAVAAHPAGEAAA